MTYEGKILKGSDHSEDIGLGGRIILKWILQIRFGRMWIGLIWFGMGSNGIILWRE